MLLTSARLKAQVPPVGVLLLDVKLLAALRTPLPGHAFSCCTLAAAGMASGLKMVDCWMPAPADVVLQSGMSRNVGDDCIWQSICHCCAMAPHALHMRGMHAIHSTVPLVEQLT